MGKLCPHIIQAAHIKLGQRSQPAFIHLNRLGSHRGLLRHWVLRWHCLRRTHSLRGRHRGTSLPHRWAHRRSGRSCNVFRYSCLRPLLLKACILRPVVLAAVEFIPPQKLRSLSGGPLYLLDPNLVGNRLQPVLYLDNICHGPMSFPSSCPATRPRPRQHPPTGLQKMVEAGTQQLLIGVKPEPLGEHPPRS